MLRCKMISHNSVKNLEKAVNAWLNSHSYVVYNQSFTFDPISANKESYVISIFYDDGSYENNSGDSVSQPIRDSKTKS